MVFYHSSPPNWVANSSKASHVVMFMAGRNGGTWGGAERTRQGARHSMGVRALGHACTAQAAQARGACSAHAHLHGRGRDEVRVRARRRPAGLHDVTQAQRLRQAVQHVVRQVVHGGLAARARARGGRGAA